MSFFNFNIEDEAVINSQVKVLEKKFAKHLTNSDELAKERKIRGYVLEAMRSYNGGYKSHPAYKTLNPMVQWLKDRGYTFKVKHGQGGGVAIFSPRNTYVVKEWVVTSEWPECISILNVIMDNKEE